MLKLDEPEVGLPLTKRLIFLTLSLVTILLLSYQVSQSQVVNFERDKADEQPKSHEIRATLNLEDQGFILVIGKELVNAPHQVYRFDAEGKLVWKKTLESEYGMNGTDVFIATPDNTFYSIQVDNERMYDKKTYVHQVSNDGTDRKFTIEGKEEFGKNLQAVFCDKDYLYFATTENGDERINRKKAAEKLILTRFDHKTMTSKSFRVNTPPILGDDKTSFWFYIGSHDDSKYFASKHVDTDMNKNEFTVITINTSGEVKGNIKMSMTLGEGKFLRPCYAEERTWNDAKQITQLDYQLKLDAQYRTSSANGTKRKGFLTERPTAYGQITYDKNNDAFLVYGLYGPKPFKRIGPVYEGSYVYKYDLKGQNVWKVQQPAGEQLMGLRAFRVDFLPTDKTIEVQPLPDKRIIVTLSEFYKTQVPFLFSPDGKLIKSDFIKAMDAPNYQAVKVMAVSGEVKSINYIETNFKKQKGRLFNILNSKGEVLIYYPGKGEPFKTIFFKK